MAILNEETTGTVIALQNEIAALKAQLMECRMTPVQRRVDTAVKEYLSSETKLTESIIVDADNSSSCSESKESDMKNTFKTDAQQLFQSLRDSLIRCEVADDCRLKAEMQIDLLTKRMNQIEKCSLSEKMKLKMRDSEIQRLKGKLATSGISQEEASGMAVEDMVKIEVDCVKQEFQGEITKLRLSNSDLERKLQTKGEVWTQQNEVEFQHSLRSHLELIEMQNKTLEKDMLNLANSKFEDITGISISDAQAMKVELETSKQTKIELEIELRATKMCFEQSLVEKNNMETSQSYAKRQFENQIEATKTYYENQIRDINNLHKSEIEDLSAQYQDSLNMVAQLKQEIQESNDSLNQKIEAMRKTDDSSKDVIRLKDIQHRKEFNTIMKEKMILLSQFRELECIVERKQDTIQDLSKKIEDLSVLYEEQTKEIDTKQQVYLNQISALTLQIEELLQGKDAQTYLVESAEERERILSSEVKMLQEQCSKYQDLCEKTNKDLEQCSFELASAKEDCDSLYTQAETVNCSLNDYKAKNESMQLKVITIYTKFIAL